MEERECHHTAGGNVNGCSHWGKEHGGSLKKPKNSLATWSSNPKSWACIQTKLQFEMIHAPQCSQQHYLQWLRHENNLNVHWQMNGYRRCVCVPISIYEYIYIYTHNGILVIKKDWNDAICSNMDRPRDHHSKWSKSERKRPYDITDMWNLKMFWFKVQSSDFSGGTVVKNPPANAGDQVWSLVQEDSTCPGATKPVSHNYEPTWCSYWSPHA